jgi:uncharacterized membrane protein YraQ (UPF0718 family)
MNQNVELFTSTVTAVFLEASPFLLFGALLSAVFEVYAPRDLIEKHMPGGRFRGLLFGLSAGMLIPTCECGVVSIVRRLLKKGVPSHVAVTYMFSAPVINPLVLAATYIAFRGDMQMVLWRVLVVAVCAGCMGAALADIEPALLLREGKSYPFVSSLAFADRATAVADHTHRGGGFVMAHDCGCGCGEVHTVSGLTRVFEHTASEFLDMGKYLVLGALAVGFFKVLFYQDLLLPFQNNVFLAIGVMMLLAFSLSICSEADAFVAVSFTSFPGVAQLAFMTLGPMVDLKLVVMYSAAFHKRIALTFILAPVLLVYILSLLASVVIR